MLNRRIDSIRERQTFAESYATDCGRQRLAGSGIEGFEGIEHLTGITFWRAAERAGLMLIDPNRRIEGKLTRPERLRATLIKVQGKPLCANGKASNRGVHPARLRRVNLSATLPTPSSARRY